MKTYTTPSLDVIGGVAQLTGVFGDSTANDVGFIPGPDITTETGSTDGVLVPCDDVTTTVC